MYFHRLSTYVITYDMAIHDFLQQLEIYMNEITFLQQLEIYMNEITVLYCNLPFFSPATPSIPIESKPYTNWSQSSNVRAIKTLLRHFFLQLI